MASTQTSPIMPPWKPKKTSSRGSVVLSATASGVAEASASTAMSG